MAVGDDATRRSVNDTFRTINKLLSGFEKWLHSRHSESGCVVNADTALVEAFEGSLKSVVVGDVRDTHHFVDPRTLSGVEGLWGVVVLFQMCPSS